jgi:hypothetical protein
MFLLVQPNGAKYRRLSYRFLGKQKTFALDVYPAVTLATARKKRDEAREQIAAGIDPGEAKKEARRAAEIAATNPFEAVAREWFDSHRPRCNDRYAEKVLHSLVVDAFPKIAPRPSRRSIGRTCTASFATSRRAACARRRSGFSSALARSSSTGS